MPDQLHIRDLNASDPEVIAAAFTSIGWHKPAALFLRYIGEQASGTRSGFVAEFGGAFCGYVTVNWKPAYHFFIEQEIPEIQDLNVLPAYRRNGIGTALLDRAEARIAQDTELAGISVGLHPGYNAAQRLYGKRGYIPDGRGITYKDRYLREGDQTILDDDLQLHLVRRIRA